METKGLISEEEEVILRAKDVCSRNDLSEKKLREEYGVLLEEYDKLNHKLSRIGHSKDCSSSKHINEKEDLHRMEKIKISNGVYWIEIPEVDMYILCGCPADSVKNLIKKGFIKKKETGGVRYETGPNVILLSDISIQNGSFANLSEFPILHMFYRQGLILPNHPNNKGIKPMLVGSKLQVKAQKEYIHRGNYGLTSIDEIMSAGIKESEANDMMRLKLRFAFDKIKKTDDLVDSRIIGRKPVELRDGVFVRRIGFNVYEFQWNSKTITVDLNLKAHEEYEPSYQLGIHEIKKEYFSVIHIGEGDGWDVNRPCMSSLIIFQGKIFLIDAGPNILHSLTSLGISINEIEGIFHTHAHDDHFAGLTSLVRSEKRIKYYATPLVRVSVVKKLAALMAMEEDHFAKYFEIHDLQFEEWNNIDGLEVKPVFSPHPVETSIMFFRTLWEDGFKSYAHLADTVALTNLEKMITDDDKKNGVSREFYKKVKESYLTPVNLKKIDIGGGSVHGRAEDFTNDKSDKIILSHREAPLTDEQKEIGSNTYFGMQDVLIPTDKNYLMLSLHQYLSTYFPKVPSHHLQLLMNCPVLSFNAGTILAKKNTISSYVFLIIGGVVEFINHREDVNFNLSAGSLIGATSGLMKEKSEGTYRAVSNIKTLRVPCDLYMEFVKRNNLYGNIKQHYENMQFLQSISLFGEIVSYTIQNTIISTMKRRVFEVDKIVGGGKKPELIILQDGEIELYSKGRKIETLERGGFCGEGSVLGQEGHLEAIASKKTRTFVVPGEVLTDIPLIQWKLLETFKKRSKR